MGWDVMWCDAMRSDGQVMPIIVTSVHRIRRREEHWMALSKAFAQRNLQLVNEAKGMRDNLR